MTKPRSRVLMVALAGVMATGMATADDGLLLRKNFASTPDLETEFAGINMAKFYVEPRSRMGRC